MTQRKTKMKPKNAFFWIFVVIVLIFIGRSLYIDDQSQTISEKNLKKFAYAFVERYNSNVESLGKNKRELNLYKNDFEFYREYPYNIKGIISNSHGASIEFIPSNKLSFSASIVNKSIENELFQDINLGIYDLLQDINATVLCWTNKESNESMFKINGSNISIKTIVIITNNGQFINITEDGEIIIDNLNVDNVIFSNLMLIKGSNKKKHLTTILAKERADRLFIDNLRTIFVNSNTFREYLSSPYLHSKAQEIWDEEHKLLEGKYDREHGALLFKKDYNELHAIAKNYNVSSEFADEVYERLRATNTRPSIFSEIFTGILNNLIWIVIIGIIGIFKISRKRKRKSTR